MLAPPLRRRAYPLHLPGDHAQLRGLPRSGLPAHVRRDTRPAEERHLPAQHHLRGRGAGTLHAQQGEALLRTKQHHRLYHQRHEDCPGDWPWQPYEHHPAVGLLPHHSGDSRRTRRGADEEVHREIVWLEGRGCGEQELRCRGPWRRIQRIRHRSCLGQPARRRSGGRRRPRLHQGSGAPHQRSGRRPAARQHFHQVRHYRRLLGSGYFCL